MSYKDIVRDLSAKNHIEYNDRELYKQVKKAMKKTGERRAQALRDIAKSNYVAEAEKFEPLKRKYRHDTTLFDSMDKEYKVAFNNLQTMSIAPVFLEEYISIIDAMAKHCDKTYEPKFMLGMNETEVKFMISNHLNTFSRLEETKYRMRTQGWEESLADIEKSRYSRVNNAIRIYANQDENEKSYIKETYIRKKAVKEELDKMGFFAKYFSAEGRAMRKYVKTAERALKDVEFPKHMEKQTEIEYCGSAVGEFEFETNYKFVEERFKQEQEKAQERENLEEKKIEQKENVQVVDNEVDPEIDKSSLKKPTNSSEVKRLFSNEKVSKSVKAQFANLIASSTKVGGNKKTEANNAFVMLGMIIGEMWKNQQDMATFSKNMFRRAYVLMNNDLPDAGVTDKIIVAQKMADIMLNTYSPAAFDDKLKEYGNNYAVQKMDRDFLKDITGETENVDKIIEDAKVELGLKAKVKFPPDEFGDDPADKSVKVEQHNAPVIENVK